MRRAILQVCSGPQRGDKAVVAGEVTVGRTDFADVVVDDRHMSSVHFALNREHVSRCGRAGGLQVDGIERDEAEVRHGTWIRAGVTDFVVRQEGATLRARDKARQRRGKARRTVREALAALRALSSPLFAVLDASRHERIGELLEESGNRCRSLFDGATSLRLSAAAPYVVVLDDGPLLDALVLEGWMGRWGVFATARCPLDELRSHLRRLTLVEDETTGRQLYFRFYDPVVFQRLWSIASVRQRAKLIGPVDSWLMSNEEGATVRFTQAFAGSAPPLLRVTGKQMQQLSENERQAFVARMTTHLAGLAPGLDGAARRALIEDGLEMARRNGIESEQGVCLFIDAMALAGGDPSRWCDASLSPLANAKRVFLRALETLQ